MNQYTVERLCTWSGVVAIALFFCAYILSGFLPPLSPAMTPDQVVAHYQEHGGGIRLGMLLMVVSCMFMAPMVGVISAQIRRIPGVSSAVTYTQICAGTANLMFFIVPALFFIIAAYRPERDPQLTFMLNDVAWIFAVLPWQPGFMQNIAIAVGVLSDRRPNPLFPRWLAYLNIWIAICYIPGGLLPFFKAGPFAWNGIFVFWLAGSTFMVWFVAMTIALLKAINQQEQRGEREFSLKAFDLTPDPRPTT